jgi:hypothetical protein
MQAITAVISPDNVWPNASTPPATPQASGPSETSKQL